MSNVVKTAAGANAQPAGAAAWSVPGRQRDRIDGR